MSKVKRNFSLILFAAVVLCPTMVNAEIIGDYPGLKQLIDKSDAIVILRIESVENCFPSVTLYSTHNCLIYQTLKGDIKVGDRIMLQLMNTRIDPLEPQSIYISPFSCGSVHLMFLKNTIGENGKAGYSTINFQGANVRLPPLPIEKISTPSIEESIKYYIKTSIEYWSKEQQKERKFLETMIVDEKKSPTAASADSNSAKYITDINSLQKAIDIAVSTKKDWWNTPAGEYRLTMARQIIKNNKNIWVIAFSNKKIWPDDISGKPVGAGGEVFVNVDLATKETVVTYGE